MTTQSDIKKYVETQIDMSLHDIYQEVYDFRVGCEDTLSNDFQIACEIEEIFRKYAARWIRITKTMVSK